MPSLVQAFSLAAAEQASIERGEPEWMLEKRRAGFAAFETMPTPDWSRGIRNWWNATLKPLDFDTLLTYAPAGNSLPDFGLTTEGETSPAGTLVQYNSQVVSITLSDEAKAAGVVFSSIEEALKTHPELVRKYFMTDNIPVTEDRFTALHAAFWTGGAFLYVPDNAVLKTPFRTVFYQDAPNLVATSHSLIITGRNSQVSIIEDQYSQGEAGQPMTVNTGVTEIFVGEGSTVDYYNPQQYAENLSNFATKRSLVGKNGLQRWVVATLGSDITRLSVESYMVGEGSRTETSGLTFTTGKQNFDIFTRTLHRVPHTSADSLFKAALNDDSQLGFRGGIRCEKKAQFTESLLEDHTLYLNSKSKADALPSLDVDANDVRCSHGASIGMIDREQIYYLQTRGLNVQEATEMITAGFFEKVIERVPLESVKERLRLAIQQKLS